MSSLGQQHLSTLTVVRTSRLHLYLAWGCPFCHRVIAAIHVAGLSDKVSVTWMRNIKGADGWQIEADDDPLFAATSLRAVYDNLSPDENRRASVPLLVDLDKQQFLSADSSEITRLFSSGINGTCSVRQNLVPAELIDRIDKHNKWLHEKVNRQVYRVGFAKSQRDYEKKVAELFQALDSLEVCLTDQPFLLGDELTESDLYLFATLIRFDSVYLPLFKCSYRRIADYPALSGYLRRLRAIDGIDASFDEYLIREHYFCSVMHVDGQARQLNPSRLIPVEPENNCQLRRCCR